jgi:hypothetical protein
LNNAVDAPVVLRSDTATSQPLADDLHIAKVSDDEFEALFYQFTHAI